MGKTLQSLKYLNSYLWKYRWRLSAGILFIICSNFFAILIAPVVRTAVDAVADNLLIYRSMEGSSVFDDLGAHLGKLALFFGGLVLISAVLKGVFLYFMRQTVIVMSRKIEFDLKNDVFKQYQKLNSAFYNKSFTGDLMSRISEDVSRVRMYLGPAIMYTINLAFMFVMVIFVMFSIHWKITLIVLAPLPFLSIAIYYISSVMNKRSDRIQAKLSDITSFVQESVSGVRVLKSFVAGPWYSQRFEKENEEYKNTNLSLVKVEALFIPMIMMLVGLSVILTVWFGGREVMNGTFSYGNIAEYIIYVNMLTWPVASLGWVTSLVQRAAASQTRINEFLQVKETVESGNNPIDSFTSEIAFEKVSFGYSPDNLVMHEVSFKLKKGKKLGIIGATGSGKTTLARLLMRMYDPTSGVIKIDGIPLKQLRTTGYRNLFGYVPQDIFLFSDSIANNMTFGLLSDEVSEAELQEMAKAADLFDDIQGFEKGFETRVGERGVSLSGGQKQRVAIARALFKQPEILILDDALSAVDTGTEKTIKENLQKMTETTTSIYISHRVSSIEDADEILVLNGGEIAERGSHVELIKMGGLYHEMYQAQTLQTTDLTQ